MQGLILHISFILLRLCLIIAFVYFVKKLRFNRFTNDIIAPVAILVSLLLLHVFRNLIFIILTKFKKTIIVKKSFVSDIDQNAIPNYILIDSNNNLYEVVNMPWFLDFNKVQDFGKLVPGNKVIITGYGYYLPVILHPYVYKVE